MEKITEYTKSPKNPEVTESPKNLENIIKDTQDKEYKVDEEYKEHKKHEEDKEHEEYKEHKKHEEDKEHEKHEEHEEHEEHKDYEEDKEDENLPPYYVDINDETYKQIKILINFCKENINKIKFEEDNEEYNDKILFLEFLQLFNNNKDKDQKGGGMERYIKMIKMFNNAFFSKSKNENLVEAINNMEQHSEFNIEDNIENNIIYNFANSIGFKENNTLNLIIDYKKYNKFIKDYHIFDYEEYTKNIIVKFENNFLKFFQNENIFSLIEKIIKKYNETRFNIFKKYIILKKINEEDNNEIPPTETSQEKESNSNEKQLFILSFDNKNFKKDKDFPNVNNIKDYILNVQDFFKDEIRKIIKMLKEYILKNDNLITFGDQEQKKSEEPEEKTKEPEEISKETSEELEKKIEEPEETPKETSEETMGGKKYKKSKKYYKKQKYKKHKRKITIKKNKNKRSRKK